MLRLSYLTQKVPSPIPPEDITIHLILLSHSPTYLVPTSHHSTTMAPLQNLAVPKGSTVLVTGANGLLGSHIADQFLEHGYKVRGTVRDTEKNAWLQTVFDKKYGKGSFELFKVPDLTVDGAFDEAVKGVLSTEEFTARD